MDHVITFTPGQVLALCSAIIVISGAVHVLIELLSRMTAPRKAHDERLKMIENKLEEHDQFFKRDLQRFENFEESNYVTQKALLALLSHSIDGNHTEDLQEAKKELQEYLIKR